MDVGRPSVAGYRERGSRPAPTDGAIVDTARNRDALGGDPSGAAHHGHRRRGRWRRLWCSQDIIGHAARAAAAWLWAPESGDIDEVRWCGGGSLAPSKPATEGLAYMRGGTPATGGYQ